MMEWTDALREYARIHNTKYRIYRKGSAEYEAVKKLQHKGKGALTKKQVTKLAKATAPPKERKTKAKAERKVKMTEEGGMKITINRSAEAGKKARKVRSDKGKKRGPRKAKEVKAESSEEEFYYA